MIWNHFDTPKTDILTIVQKKRGPANTSLSCSCHFAFETRIDGIKIAKMANDHCCAPLCNNDKQYNSGKDPSPFNFPRDKQRWKCMASSESNIYLKYIVYARLASFQIQNGSCVIMVYTVYVWHYNYDKLPKQIHRKVPTASNNLKNKHILTKLQQYSLIINSYSSRTRRIWADM